MAMTREQALKIKESAENYLKKLERDEKSETKMLANKYEEIMRGINSVLSGLSQSRESEQVMAALKVLKVDLGRAIKSSTPDMTPLIGAVRSLESAIKAQKQPEVGVVQSIERLGKQISSLPKPKDSKDRTDELLKAIKSIKLEAGNIEFPESIAVNNFPPQKIPQPVSHININAHNGYIKTTATTVTSSLTTLPGYGVLDNRRAVQVYNNDASATLYIGGSDVTTTNGIPVPAQSFSTIIDAGETMILYGVVSTGSINVRVIEISDEAGGR